MEHDERHANRELSNEEIVAAISSVPTGVLEKFESMRGVPPQVIGEMFHQIGAPAAVQKAFWKRTRSSAA